jgi:hypothetical protein
VTAATAVPMVGTTFGIDSPRARRSDPTTSQHAADATSHGIKATKRRVLELVLQETEITGSELNDLYELRCARNGWPILHVDTPRKRAGELVVDGLLEVVREEQSNGNHLPESVYGLTVAGRKFLGVVTP